MTVEKKQGVRVSISSIIPGQSRLVCELGLVITKTAPMLSQINTLAIDRMKDRCLEKHVQWRIIFPSFKVWLAYRMYLISHFFST